MLIAPSFRAVEKPAFGTPINWGHPLTKGLVGLWLLNDAGGNRIVNRAFPVEGEFVGAPAWERNGIKFNGAGDRIRIPTYPEISTIIDDNWTMMVIATANALSAPGFAAPLGNNGSVVIAINPSNSWYASFTVDPSEYGDTSTPATVGERVILVGVYNGTRSRLYKNGVRTQNVLRNVPMTSVPFDWYIGASAGDGSSPFNGWVEMAALWNVALNQDDVTEISEDPYAIFQELGRRIGMLTVPAPGPVSYYEEVIDYGAVLNNIIVNINYASYPIAGTVVIAIKMAVSTDGVAYSAFTSGPSQFFASFRYLKLRLEFDPTDDKGLIEVDSLRITLDVKREVDSGEVSALAADVGGTTVSFNKTFKDIDSLTATARSVVERTVVIDFVDAPNPTTFKVLVFNAAGARVDSLVDWKARGIT